MIDLMERHETWLSQRQAEILDHNKSLSGWPVEARREIGRQTRHEREQAIAAAYRGGRLLSRPVVGLCACGLRAVLFDGKCVGCS